MDLQIALLAALSGYLLGSISFARVIKGIFAPDRDISKIEVTVPESEARMESDTISATTVRLFIGPQYGCATSVLDMLKAAFPALVFRLWQPEAPYYLLAAGMATVGHNWPVFHRFVGGRGLSPVLGGFLVLDWVGTLVTNLVALVLGLPIKNMLVITGAGIVFMIPWIWFRSRDIWELAYVVAMNVLFWTAMIPELKEYARLLREGTLKDLRDARRIRVLSRDGTERYDEATLTNLMEKIAALIRGLRAGG